MSETPRLRWPYPDDRARDWYESFVRLVEAFDAAVFARAEDAQTLFSEGGTFTFSPSTDTFSWSSTWLIHAATTGYTWALAAASHTLRDGEYLYVVLPRSPQGQVVVTAQTGTQVADTENGFILGRRSGSYFILRPGVPILGPRSGSLAQLTGPLSANILAALTAAAAPTALNPFVTMADVGGGGYPELGLGGSIVCDGSQGGAWSLAATFYYAPAEHPGVASLTLRAEGHTSSGGYTGSVRVYDPVAGVSLGSGTITGVAPAVLDVLLSAVPATPRMLLIQASSPIGTGSDQFRLTRAALRRA